MTDTSRANNGGWIGVDLDGTLAHYEGFKGDDFVGAPIDPMVKQVRRWLREGHDVRLFTARKPSPVIRRWMFEHLGSVLPITNIKDHNMQALYDDRCVQVRRNEGTFREEDLKQIRRDV